MNFLKRIFGFFSREVPDRGASVAPEAWPGGGAQLRVEAPRSVLVSWHEMLDAQARIGGYLLPVSPVCAGDVIGGAQLRTCLLEENLQRLAERRLVVLPLSVAQWQGADFRELISAHTFFLLAVAAPESWRSVAREIRAAGARVAVDAAFFDDPELAVEPVDLVLLDAHAAEFAVLEEKIMGLRQRHPGVPLVIREVASWAEFRFFQSLGVDYCVGGFAATLDAAESSGHIGQSRLVVLEMLEQLRSEADLSCLAATAKRDPAVVLKLLEMANSPLAGLSRRVANLEDAIVLLGRDAVYRWLTLAMFRIDATRGLDETLFVIALSRASCLEALAPAGDKKVASELFLVGMLSVVDSLLGVPMADALKKMHLPEAVAAALLKQEGVYIRYLLLMISLERCRIEQAVSLAGLIGIDPALLLTNYSKAMAWATADLRAPG